MNETVLRSDTGYGVMQDGKLLIRTVTTSPRNAMLNGLVLCFGFNAHRAEWADDDLIRYYWQHMARPGQYEIVACEAVTDGVPVDITGDISEKWPEYPLERKLHEDQG